ncbi:MAG: hypothetical protein DCC66_10145, partial [Planctomycetota bacterium]
DNQPTVYIRWGMGVTDSSVTYQGWNIDDVEIWGLVPSPCLGTTPGDVNQNTLVDGGDIGDFIRVLLDPPSATPAERCAADVSANGTVELADVDPFVQLLVGP